MGEASAAVSWSGGKDSALAFYALERMGYSVEWFLVTVDAEAQVVTGHRVPVELVREQATAAGVRVLEVLLPGDLAPAEIYEARILDAYKVLRSRGVEYVGHGDLFLRDMMDYKSDLARRAGLEALYPLDGLPSRVVVESFLQLGMSAVVAAVDTGRLYPWLACSELDKGFLDHLPSTVDEAGEYGEFHTFVYRHPMFSRNIPVVRDGWYRYGWKSVCNLRPRLPGVASRSHP